MIRYVSCYPIPGVYEAPDKLWPDIDALLKENIPELFFFNDEKSHSREESILCLWWPCHIRIENVIYNSVGQFIEAEKARLFGDLKTRDKILRVSSKNEILALGKRIMGYNESKWRDIYYAVVLYGNYYKFQKNEECRNELLKTKDYILVYDISTDTDWGAGFKRTDSRIFNPNNWDINNLLGFTLMEVRKLITRSAMKKVLTTWTKKMKFDQNDENYINSLIAKEAWKEAIEFKEKLFLEHRYEVAEKNAKTCSGVFTAHGMVLLDFKPDKENVIMNEDGHCMLRNLVFPQTDITYIADGVFNGIEVRGELQLPNKTIGIGMKGGEGVFKNCKFSKLYIPSEVSSLGDYAFAKCEIGVLKLYPSALKSEYGRQFKGATIEKLYLPENSLPMSCSEYGVLHSIAVNASVKEVYLDKFVHLSWEDFVKQI